MKISKYTLVFLWLVAAGIRYAAQLFRMCSMIFLFTLLFLSVNGLVFAAQEDIAKVCVMSPIVATLFGVDATFSRGNLTSSGIVYNENHPYAKEESPDVRLFFFADQEDMFDAIQMYDWVGSRFVRTHYEKAMLAGKLCSMQGLYRMNKLEGLSNFRDPDAYVSLKDDPAVRNGIVTPVYERTVISPEAAQLAIKHATTLELLRSWRTLALCEYRLRQGRGLQPLMNRVPLYMPLAIPRSNLFYGALHAAREGLPAVIPAVPDIDLP